MKITTYLRTVILNLLFLLIIPLVYSFMVNDSVIAVFLYVVVYSVIEHQLDIRFYKGTYGNKSRVIDLCITAVFNAVLLFGASLILSCLLFRISLILIIIFILVYILLLSKFELFVDARLNRGR